MVKHSYHAPQHGGIRKTLHLVDILPPNSESQLNQEETSNKLNFRDILQNSSSNSEDHEKPGKIKKR